MFSFSSKKFQASAAVAAMLLGVPHRPAQASDAFQAPTYTLNFTMDTNDVQTINDIGQYITIVKSVARSGAETSKGPPVAWLTFRAAQVIQVSWEEDYWLYATAQESQAGARITATAMTTFPARRGLEYEFRSNLFMGPTMMSGLAEGTFHVSNKVGNNNWQFGLAQKARVSTEFGSTMKAVPINIVPVMNNQRVSFTPTDTVSISLQSFSDNGVVLSQVSSEALLVKLEPGAPSAEIGFDARVNKFYRADTSR